MEDPPANTLRTTVPLAYTLIATMDNFRQMLQRLKRVNRLAIDIEADSLYHYFDKVCLIQISTDEETYILDPLGVNDIKELASIMSDPSVEKVLHAAAYDVYCLRRDYDFSFANIFDTHIAAQLLGREFLGLSTLMEEFLAVRHSKKRQRDDWSRRPLTREQLEYAAMDTHYLLPLRDALEAELRQKGRFDWAQEEFAISATAERSEKEFDPEGFRRIKGSHELSPRDQAILRALYVFRDKAARELDVPPFKVLNNSILLDLAQRPPKSVKELFRRRGIYPRIARKYGAAMVRTIAKTRRSGPSLVEKPVNNNGQTPDRIIKQRLESLRAWRQAKGRELDLPVGVVFPANLLENLAMAPPESVEELANVPGMRRWRVREFGTEVLQILRQEDS